MIFYLTFEHLCSVMMVLYIVMGGAVCRVGSSFTRTKCAVQDHVNHWMLSACLSVCPSVPLFIDQDNLWNSEQILSLDRVCTIMQGCKWLAFGCKRSMVTGSWSVWKYQKISCNCDNLKSNQFSCQLFSGILQNLLYVCDW